MSQTLSAMTYLKNNKRRVAVMIGSLALGFVLFYISKFVLFSTTETFGSMLLDNAKKVQYISLPGYVFDLDFEELGEEKFEKQYYEQHLELGKRLKEIKGVKDAYYAQINYVEILGAVGQYYTELPMVSKDKVKELLEHFGATLSQGNMPKKNNEIVLDEKSMKNGSYQIGDSLRDYPKIKIVGIISCDYYFGCGVMEGKQYSNGELLMLSDGEIEDVTSLLHTMGYQFDKSDAHIVDEKEGKRVLEKDIIGAISTSTNVIYIGIISILSISLFVVYLTYLRDRRNEWCLYCSIGFSRRSIYFAVIRELLITFATAVILGVVICAGLMVLLDYGMIRPLGLLCKYVYPEELLEILAVFALIFGGLQLPIRFELYKIKTIDAIDDDLN